MKRLIASIIIGLCIFLGNISSQAKSFHIIGHVSLEHSSHLIVHSHHHHSHHHGHGKHHKEAKNKKASRSHEHQHSTELSQLTIQLALPSLRAITYNLPLCFPPTSGFYTFEDLNQLSFSPPVFRPPIA